MEFLLEEEDSRGDVKTEPARFKQAMRYIVSRLIRSCTMNISAQDFLKKTAIYFENGNFSSNFNEA